jgi:pyrroloquinoline quinone biosynthesis protein B
MKLNILTLSLMSLTLGLSACNNSDSSSASVEASCNTSLYVLGIGQDAGKPQIGVHSDPAWTTPSSRALATSIAVVDKESGARYLFDAAPEMKAQLFMLDQQAGATGFRLDGVFLTHGHMGHYLGLAHLGREAMNAKSIPVYAMPKMENFLRNNGPWDQLVTLNNIEIVGLEDQRPVSVQGGISVTPFSVPHRGEYTETVGYKIQGDGKSAIYLPDIDTWEEWAAEGTNLADVIAENDLLFLDASFYNGEELPGRDMSKIPHPTMSHTMDYLRAISAADRKKVQFIHLNHTNPAHDIHTKAFEEVEKAGYSVAKMGSQHCLD